MGTIQHGRESAGRPPTLPTELMHRLVRAGLTNREISDRLVSRGYLPDLGGALAASSPAISAWRKRSSSAISAWKKRHGYELWQSTEERLKLIPWKVAVKDSRHRYYACLALEARSRSGGALAPKDRGRLDKFKRELAEANAVIHYDRVNGWVALRPRPGIDLDWIRDPRIANDGTPIEYKNT